MEDWEIKYDEYIKAIQEWIAEPQKDQYLQEWINEYIEKMFDLALGGI